MGTVTPGSRVFPGQVTSSTTLRIIYNELRPRISHVAFWVQGPHLVEPQHLTVPSMWQALAKCLVSRGTGKHAKEWQACLNHSHFQAAYMCMRNTDWPDLSMSPKQLRGSPLQITQCIPNHQVHSKSSPFDISLAASFLAACSNWID